MAVTVLFCQTELHPLERALSTIHRHISFMSYEVSFDIFTCHFVPLVETCDSDSEASFRIEGGNGWVQHLVGFGDVGV